MPTSSPFAATRCTVTGRAPFRPRRSCASSSTRRASRLPAHGEEPARTRRVEAVHELVLLVERVLDLRRDVQVLADVVARRRIDDRIGGIEPSRAGNDVAVGTRARADDLAAQAQLAEAAIGCER